MTLVLFGYPKATFWCNLDEYSETQKNATPERHARATHIVAPDIGQYRIILTIFEIEFANLKWMRMPHTPITIKPLQGHIFCYAVNFPSITNQEIRRVDI